MVFADVARDTPLFTFWCCATKYPKAIAGVADLIGNSFSSSTEPSSTPLRG
tara:strand:- start:1117 stop:1269 length:153 start_codon:yes stop_codon:yes gene_type:complete